MWFWGCFVSFVAVDEKDERESMEKKILRRQSFMLSIKKTHLTKLLMINS